MEQLMTPAEVADKLQIPVQTLYHWRSQKKGPVGIRFGRHLRYHPKAVQDYLDAHTEDDRSAA